jgi:uridine kinase
MASSSWLSVTAGNSVLWAYIEMVSMSREPSRPCVVVVSGSVGSGKTTLVERLAELLGGAPTLIFDHYDRYAEWPQDLDQWMRAGADPNEVRVPRLKEDLLLLLEGASITYPFDNRVVDPAEYILIEEPFGRERQEIAGHIDLVVYLDVPQDVCAVRVVQRALGMAGVDAEKGVEDEAREDLARRLKAVASWVSHYVRMRSAYIEVSNAVKQKADIVVDGLKPVDEIA